MIFDKFNVNFQTSKAATIHRLHSECERLLSKVLTLFIKPSVVRQNAKDLTKIDYSNPNNHLADGDIYLGDETAAFYLRMRVLLSAISMMMLNSFILHFLTN